MHTPSMHTPSLNDPPVYPNDGPTAASPKRVVEIGERDQLREALRALALMPRAKDHEQRVVIVSTEHRAFAVLAGENWQLAATALAEAGIVALTDIEARRVGFAPAGRDEYLRLERDGLLVADIRRDSIRLAANNLSPAQASGWARTDDPDLVPAKTQRRRARLAARAARS
jgi:hypothetical protein